jgi:hypothetical protein
MCITLCLVVKFVRHEAGERCALMWLPLHFDVCISTAWYSSVGLPGMLAYEGS